MKKAISISGQQRFVKEGLKSLQTNLVDFNNYDVFIHTWKDLTVNESDLNLYNPKKILIEDPIIFNEECSKTNTHKSMFYSISKSLDLLLNYSKEYDAVIRTRFDIFLQDKLDLNNYPLDTGIFSPDMCRNSAVISDWFNFGSIKNIIPYRDMFYNYDLLKSLNVNVHSGEEIITATLRQLKIKMFKIRKKLLLLRSREVETLSTGWEYVDVLFPETA
jgi:hypothetical protein